MKISVVTVCRNAAGTIAHTIESVLSQGYADKELVVCDGASTDGTQDIVGRYLAAGVRLTSQPDRGMYDALNAGFARSTGAAVGALNADDTFHDTGCLGRIAEALAEADIVHGDLDFVDGHADKRVLRRWRSGPRPRSGFRGGWMPAHPTFYVRRAVLAAVGPFDLAYSLAADYDFMLRAVELTTFRTCHVDAVLVDMAQGGQSAASVRARVRHNMEAMASRRRWLKTPIIDPALLAKPARKLGQLVVR
ncbi:glycosyltransferase family 2 protein [Acuticoccus sp.]|uniref:glycosyltransferase family 2 protein n=1 Tax=Acuticoccus sp. TaxID=1904378 RepID=UPI003B522CFA